MLTLLRLKLKVNKMRKAKKSLKEKKRKRRRKKEKVLMPKLQVELTPKLQEGLLLSQDLKSLKTLPRKLAQSLEKPLKRVVSNHLPIRGPWTRCF
jgi:hypothetical protein